MLQFETKTMELCVRDDEMRSSCNDIDDYVQRFFFRLFRLPDDSEILNYIEQYIFITFDIRSHLTVADVLFGIKQHNYGKVKTKRINYTLLIAKVCGCIYKKTNSFLPLAMLLENQLTHGSI